MQVSLLARSYRWMGGVAQLVERRTGTLLATGSIPGVARNFFSQSQLSAQTLFTVSIHSRVQSNALTPVRKLNAAENAANMQNCEVETHRTLLCRTNTATQIVPYKTLLAMLCLTKHLSLIHI